MAAALKQEDPSLLLPLSLQAAFCCTSQSSPFFAARFSRLPCLGFVEIVGEDGGFIGSGLSRPFHLEAEIRPFFTPLFVSANQILLK